MPYGQVTQIFSFGADVWDLQNHLRLPGNFEQLDGQIPELGSLVTFQVDDDGFARVERVVPADSVPDGLGAMADFSVFEDVSNGS